MQLKEARAHLRCRCARFSVVSTQPTPRLEIAVSARLLLPVVLALAIAGATAPAAHTAWTPPRAVTGPDATNVHAAGNRRGSETFAWKVTSTRTLRLPAQTGFASWIRARVRLPDGRLGRAQTISSTREIVTGPQIGVADTGDATAVWTQAGRHIRIMAAFRERGRTFGPPVEIGRSTHFNDARPALLVGRFGDTVIAWNAGRSLDVRRYAGNAQCPSRRHFACLTAPLRLRPGADHAVALGPLGTAYVVWSAIMRSGDDAGTRLRMVVVRRSGRTSREHVVSGAADGNAGQPTIAVRADGIADIAWRSSLPAGSEQNELAPIRAAASSPDALVAAPQVVSQQPGDQSRSCGSTAGARRSSRGTASPRRRRTPTGR